MPENGHFDAIAAGTEDGWTVCADGGRLVLRNGDSALAVAIDAPLRWTRDGAAVSFEDALGIVPEALHGWMALAALIGLRHCLGGLATGVALPAGYQEWPWMAQRAAPLQGWMQGLARLDGADVPELPAGIDDGLADLEEPSAN
jgi:hypothetical protein